MIENVNEGNTGDTAESQEVKSPEQNEQEQPKAEEIDVTGENSVVVEEVVTEFDPDEKIISDMYDSGKTEVTSSELIKAGFDTNRMASYSFNIGQFKLSRLMLVSPYTIEKNS